LRLNHSYHHVLRHFCFFFNVTAPSEIYTLSLHDALPIFASLSRLSRRTCSSLPPPAFSRKKSGRGMRGVLISRGPARALFTPWRDRKSTRLNSSHVAISYAVFCLKKKKNIGPARSRMDHR